MSVSKTGVEWYRGKGTNWATVARAFIIPSSSMSATRESALKVSRSSADISPANALMNSHLWVIFDVDKASVENVLTLEDPWSCLRVTINLPGRGLSALEIRKRGVGAARAERVQRVRVMSWEQDIVEKLATGDHRERNEHHQEKGHQIIYLSHLFKFVCDRSLPFRSCQII